LSGQTTIPVGHVTYVGHLSRLSVQVIPSEHLAKVTPLIMQVGSVGHIAI